MLTRKINITEIILQFRSILHNKKCFNQIVTFLHKSNVQIHSQQRGGDPRAHGDLQAGIATSRYGAGLLQTLPTTRAQRV